MLCKSTPVSSHDLITANHRQISLTGIDHYNSKLCKVTHFFNIWEPLQENLKSTTYTTVFLPDSNNCFFYVVSYFNIRLHYFFIFLVLFHLLFLNLLSLKHILQFSYNSTSLQHRLNSSISLKYTIQKIFTKLQKTFQNEERNVEKESL